jgi:hypothetical protein
MGGSRTAVHSGLCFGQVRLADFYTAGLALLPGPAGAGMPGGVLMKEKITTILMLAIAFLIVAGLFAVIGNQLKAIEETRLTCLQAGYSDGTVKLGGEVWCYRALGDVGEIRLYKSLEVNDEQD